MLAVLGHEMKEIDRRMIEEIGLPGMVLMESAGRAVVKEIAACKVKKVLIIAGSGNNGGDGLVIARYLKEQGCEVTVWLAARKEKLRGDVGQNLLILEKILAPAQLKEILTSDDLVACETDLEQSELIVDALLGTGLKGNVSGLKAEIIRLVNQTTAPVIAVDIPSGLNSDTGEIMGECVKAEKTVTFGFLKVGLCLYPGVDYAGEVITADIGIVKQVTEDLKHHYLDKSEMSRLLPRRAGDSHKGSVGRVLVAAGSKGMLGAALMASKAALRAGAGLVTLAVPESLVLPAMTQLTEVIVRGLPESSSGSLGLCSWHALQSLLPKNDVLLFGPGISHNPETELLTLQILENTDLPLVLDADGLNCVSAHRDFLDKKRANLILTPHWGEMARLTGKTIEEIKLERLNLVRDKSRRWGCTLVLKGARTLIGAGGNVYINSTGNAGMATAGAGDVLAGIIAGLWAGRMSAREAALLGVYLHGLAGDLACREKGELGLIASDLIEFLPEAVLSLLYFS